ncbi:glycosyl hydrolase [Bacteroides sp. UBA939]|uniref:glycosyl hydrolase n=1 Tax=Bacteroides sp. UBA939 TaxID=1946092 RepID=UPI0025C49276|nr:glycosyl hydrolase [Bacteroides sp. UBA939]
MRLEFVTLHKCIDKLFGCFLLLPLLYACGDRDSSQEEPQIDVPQFVFSTPADGATDVPDTDLNVVLTYNQNVTVSSVGHNRITVTGATVEAVSVSLKNVTIRLSGLEKEKTYSLVVPKGIVLGSTGMEASQVMVSFSTVKKPEVIPVATELCTSDPLPQAKKVYDYLVSVYGSKALSASMANVNWNVAEADLVHKATGKYPAIAFFDYIHLAWSPANWIDYSNTKVVEDWWNANGLVGASWHWTVPATEGETDLNKYAYAPGNGRQNNEGNWTTTFRPKNIFVEGSWENKTAKADLEKMAGYLKLLQDKGIPLIWRPLHEAAGNIYEYNGGTAWFWWGYDGAETYKKLWRYMFDFFKEKGINNLIWVWTTQTEDADFYPGDEYVDIVGRDIYGQTSGANNASQYNLIFDSYSQKMIALSECGNVAKFSAQWNAGAHWSFFMPWYQYNATTLVGHQHANEAWWKDAMNQDFVITRDQVPSME